MVKGRKLHVFILGCVLAGTCPHAYAAGGAFLQNGVPVEQIYIRPNTVTSLDLGVMPWMQPFDLAGYELHFGLDGLHPIEWTDPNPMTMVFGTVETGVMGLLFEPRPLDQGQFNTLGTLHFEAGSRGTYFIDLVPFGSSVIGDDSTGTPEVIVMETGPLAVSVGSPAPFTGEIAPQITSYTATAYANGSTDTMTNATAKAEGYYPGNMWDSRATSNVGTFVDPDSRVTAIEILLTGHPGIEEIWQGDDLPPDMIELPANAWGSFEGDVFFEPTEEIPEGTLLSVQLSMTLDGTTTNDSGMNNFDWSCELYRGDTLLTTLHPSMEEDEVLLYAGETDLSIKFEARDFTEASYDDFDFAATLWMTGTVVPEPATLSLLGLGGLALIRRRAQA